MGKLKDQTFHQHSKSKTAGSRHKKNPIKVTYISTPMKVKASSASEFRAIVQELTGKNSDVVRDHSDDNSYATVDLPEEGNNIRVVNHEANRHMKNDINVIAAHEDFLDDAFSSHVSSVLDQLDERFMWRDVSAETSFGFQSPYCLSLYD